MCLIFMLFGEHTIKIICSSVCEMFDCLKKMLDRSMLNRYDVFCVTNLGGVNSWLTFDKKNCLRLKIERYNRHGGEMRFAEPFNQTFALFLGLTKHML